MTAALKIERYSDKAVIVRGDTYPHKERIKAAVPNTRAIWHHKAKGWIFSAKHEAALSVALSDLLTDGLGEFSNAPPQVKQSGQIDQKAGLPVADDLPGKWGLLAG